MKKLTFVAAMAITAAAFTSCGNSTPSASLKSDVDSMSYAIGLAQTQGLKDYLIGRMGIDTVYMNDFIKGLNEGANAGDDKKKAAYIAGLQIGQQVSTQIIPSINHEVFGEDSTQTVSMKNFMAGFVSGTTGKGAKMTMEMANTVAQIKMKEIKAKRLETVYGENKKAGEEFLAKMEKEEGVQKLPSGVLYKVIKAGSGAIPADTSKVKCHYEGRNLQDSIFDSSYKRNRPMETYCNRVIKGWTDALTHMPVGSIWEVYIPRELAYGEQERSEFIKPFSMLKFKIELLEIVDEK